ncbi:MAG: zf-HC2 domain-containing protein [Oscillibacter sp.]|jgi:hypothetical protein|nr:zf-HC2 domain-containing protein [Oscillibacter sp.]
MKYCEEYAALLDAFADGECTEAEAARVREHLRSCPGCRAYLEELQQIRDAFPRDDDVEVPPGFADGVMAAVRARAVPRKRKTVYWARVLVPLAACLAVVILTRSLPFGSEAHTAPADAARETSSESAAYGAVLPREKTAGSSETETQNTAGLSQGSAPASGGAAAPDQAAQPAAPRKSTAKQSSGSPAAAPSIDAAVPETEQEQTPECTFTTVSPDNGETAAPAEGSSSGGDTSGSTGASGGETSGGDSSGTDSSGGALSGEAPGNGAVSNGSSSAGVWRKTATLTAAQVGSALDGYESAQETDPVTGGPALAYELDEAAFDAVIGALGAEDSVTVSQQSDSELCRILVVT